MGEMAQAFVQGAMDWWADVNNSNVWQDRIFYTLSGLYGFVAAVALVSIILLAACCFLFILVGFAIRLIHLKEYS